MCAWNVQGRCAYRTATAWSLQADSLTCCCMPGTSTRGVNTTRAAVTILQCSLASSPARCVVSSRVAALPRSDMRGGAMTVVVVLLRGLCVAPGLLARGMATCPA